MQRETNSVSADKQAPSGVLPLTSDILQMRRMREKGWTIKSLAKRFNRTIEDVRRDLGPTL